MTGNDQPAARVRRRRILVVVAAVVILAVLAAPELALVLARCWLPLAIDGPDAGATIASTSPWGSPGHDLSLDLTPGRVRTLLSSASGRWIPLLPLYPGMSVSGELRVRAAAPTSSPAGSSPAGAATAAPVRLTAQVQLRLLGAHPLLRVRLTPAVADALLSSTLHLRLGLMQLTLHPRSAAIDPLEPPPGGASAVHVTMSGSLELDFGSASEQVVVDRLAGTVSVSFERLPDGLRPVVLVHLEGIEVEGPEAQTLDSDITRQQIEAMLNASLASSLATARLPAWFPTDCRLAGSIAPSSAP